LKQKCDELEQEIEIKKQKREALKQELEVLKQGNDHPLKHRKVKGLEQAKLKRDRQIDA
jgi:hypothetical protein